MTELRAIISISITNAPVLLIQQKRNEEKLFCFSSFVRSMRCPFTRTTSWNNHRTYIFFVHLFHLIFRVRHFFLLVCRPMCLWRPTSWSSGPNNWELAKSEHFKNCFAACFGRRNKLNSNVVYLSRSHTQISHSLIGWQRRMCGQRASNSFTEWKQQTVNGIRI